MTEETVEVPRSQLEAWLKEIRQLKSELKARVP
jgi:hypothetical protein